MLSAHRKESSNLELVLFLLSPYSVKEQKEDKSVEALRRLLFSAPNFKCRELTCHSEHRSRLTKPRSNTDGCMDQAAFLPSIYSKNKRGHTALAVLILTSCSMDLDHQLSYLSQSQQHEHSLPGLPEGQYPQKDSPPSGCISYALPCVGSLRIA